MTPDSGHDHVGEMQAGAAEAAGAAGAIAQCLSACLAWLIPNSGKRREIWTDTKTVPYIRAGRMVSAAEVHTQEEPLKTEKGMNGICGQSTKIVEIHTVKGLSYLDQNV